MKRPWSLGIAVLVCVASACSVGHYSVSMQYGDDLLPAPLLSGASPLASNWSIPGSSHSTHSGGTGWVSSVDFSGTFQCDATDLEELAAALFVALKDDVFGKGFQLREGSTVDTQGPHHAIEILVLFEDDHQLGTTHFTAQPAPTPPGFEYELNVSEETR